MMCLCVSREPDGLFSYMFLCSNVEFINWTEPCILCPNFQFSKGSSRDSSLFRKNGKNDYSGLELV